MPTATLKDDDGKEVGLIVLQRRGPANPFSTGSLGFYAGGKYQLPDGKTYQMSFSLVEIGSKNRSQ